MLGNFSTVLKVCEKCDIYFTLLFEKHVNILCNISHSMWKYLEFSTIFKVFEIMWISISHYYWKNMWISCVLFHIVCEGIWKFLPFSKCLKLCEYLSHTIIRKTFENISHSMWKYLETFCCFQSVWNYVNIYNVMHLNVAHARVSAM